MNLFFAIFLTLFLGDAAPALKTDISLDDHHQIWQPLTDSTEIPFRSDCWIRVSIPANDAKEMVLKAGNWYMRGLEFYDSNWQRIGAGNQIDINGESSHLIYIYYPFIDEKSGSVELELMSKTDYLERIGQKNAFQIGFQTIFLFVALILLLLALRSKNNLYWHFFFYVSSISYFFAYQYGLLGGLFPFINSISPTWWWISSASLSLSYAFFAQSFLRLKEKDRITYNLFEFGKYFILLVVIAEVTSHLMAYDLQHQLGYKLLLIVIETPLMIWIIYRIFRSGDILSQIFVSGMLILAFSSLTAQLLSTFRLTVETNYFIQAGLLLDILLFSIGISIRIGLVYKDREKAQGKLIEQLQLNEEFQKKYTDELEETVKLRTAELDKRNDENELLLGEVHHRVKNNLQMIGSLLNMQKRRLTDEQSKEVIKITQARVRSIGLIHEHLYQHNDFSKTNLHDYIHDLVAFLVESEQFETKPRVNLEIDQLWADIDTSIPIGLVLNELITNSIKYAFSTTKSPELRISLKDKSDNAELEVSDNGKSNPNGDYTDGFGWTIIKSTLASIGAEYNICHDHGFKISMTIPIKK